MGLIDVDALKARLTDENLRIADVRWYLNKPGAGRAAYEGGHIPGAFFVDLDTDLADMAGYGAPGRHPLPSVEAFRDRMESLGIGSDTYVVAYDDVGGAVAARLWWMLDNLGHRGGAAVLDGGINAWVEHGLPLSTDEPHYDTARLALADRWTNVIARDELAARLGQVTLLDSRAGERYRGEVEPIDPNPGHIPTAISAPTMSNLDGSGRFLDQPALIARFAGLLADDRPTVTYCGSGTNACHNALAMRMAGLPNPILYVGSYSDWSRSGMPTDK
ncbi:MAG: thiosulfate/3-mercaptopyruvate sulfurtransferase [Chloroflexota bacterium]|jgi:thiosulfate/3-mercaptopyruvate sulfurtransferase|nr:thiosulfate/3-mercaptopyruvate sulfurtransferase [Chloroflexota bacterium]